MFAGVFALLMLGYPVAFSLVGTAILMAALGSFLGVFDSTCSRRCRCASSG
jgi:TRAP-type mannitol/chloroaromatic compound transport system permease large subunit